MLALGLKSDEMMRMVDDAMQEAFTEADDLKDSDNTGKVVFLLARLSLAWAGVIEANNRKIEERLSSLGVLPPSV